MCHAVDTGGTRPGSFCGDAIDRDAEGIELPATKLVEAGHIVSDVQQLIMSHTRMPATVDLDLRGLFGADDTAVRAMAALVDMCGAETLRAVLARLIELSDAPDRRPVPSARRVIVLGMRRRR